MQKGQDARGRSGTGSHSDATWSLHARIPQPAREAADVALHHADQVHFFNAGSTVVADYSGQAKQQKGQRAAAAQQLKPLVHQV